MLQSIRDTNSSNIRHMMLLELLISSILPIAAVLILAVIGIRMIPAAQIGNFIIAFTLCAIAPFLSICFIMIQTQHTIRKRVQELIVSCQTYVAGQTSTRAPVYGNDDFAHLAIEINRLLNIHASAPNPQQSEQQWQTQNSPATSRPGSDHAAYQQASFQTVPNPYPTSQLEKLLEEISPVMDGDLRVRARATTREVGTIADTVNFLIEELTQQVKQIRSASDHILSATRDLLDRSIEMAQTTEAQMNLLTQTTEQIEKLVAFTQRLTGALVISTEAARTLQGFLHRGEDTLTRASEHVHQIWQTLQSLARQQNGKQQGQPLVLPPASYQRLQQEVQTLALQLQGLSSNEALHDIQEPGTESRNDQPILSSMREDIQRQLKLLSTVEYSAEEKVSTAEEVVTELYTLARRIHQASMGVMNAAERVSSLAVLADEWRNTTANFVLQGEDRPGRTQIFEEEIDLGSFPPFPSAEKQHTM